MSWIRINNSDLELNLRFLTKKLPQGFFKSRKHVTYVQCCGYVFRSFVDPDSYSEHGSGFTHVKIG